MTIAIVEATLNQVDNSVEHRGRVGGIIVLGLVLIVGAWQARLRLQPSTKSASVSREPQVTEVAQGEQVEAQRAAQQLCQVNPSDPHAWLALGDLEVKLDHGPAATDAYQHALKLAPHDPEILCALAQAELNREHLPRAEALVEQAERVAPQAALPHFMKGRILLRTQMVEVAIPEFRQAVKLQPDYLPGWLALALAALQTKQFTTTEDACRQATRLDPQNAGAWGLWAQAKLEQDTPQNMQEAKSLAEKALSLQPQQVGSHYVLGVLNLRANNIPEAITHLETVLSTDPTRLDARANLVKAYQRAGRMADAEQQLKVLDAQTDYEKKVNVLETQIQTHPRDADLHRRLGELYASVGRSNKAMMEYERALELNPKLQPAQTALQQLREARKGSDNKS